jgi:zinc transport system ATP-binding protein
VRRTCGQITNCSANVSSHGYNYKIEKIESRYARVGDVLDCAVEFSGVSYAYERENVLRDVTFCIPHGGFAAVIGPNGGGKSTLLKIMLGLIPVKNGGVSLFGRPPLQSGSRVGYVPQDANLNKTLPIMVREVARMGQLPNVGKNADENIVRESLARFGLWELRNSLIGALSQGQRQRVLLARALATKPDLLVLDEPCASLDAEGHELLEGVLSELSKKITIVIVSHDLLLVSGLSTAMIRVNRSVTYHKTEVKK